MILLKITKIRTF